MSRRLHQRGRYPKAPGVDHHITNSSSQFPPTSLAQCPVTSDVPYYPPVQSQPAQNVWNQSPYPNSSTYQSNQAHPVSAPSSYWATGQVYPVQMQQQSDPWNWKVENNAENSSYPNYQHQQSNSNYQHQHPQLDANYQNQHLQPDPNYQQQHQPQPDPNYQQLQPPQLDPNYQPQLQQSNPNYQQLNPSYIQQPDPNFQPHQQQPDSNYHQPGAVYQQHHQQQIVPSESWPQISKSKVENQNIQQPMTYSTPSQIYEPSLDSQPTNNNSSNSTLDTSLQSWENGSLNITEPTELPWTYSAPQYCNPPTTANFPSNTVPSSVPWNSSPLTTSDPDDTKVPSNYLSNDDSVTNGTVDISNSITKSDVNELKDDSDSSNAHDCDTASINRDLLIDTEFGTSSLSAFFQNSQNNSGNNSEYGGASTPDVKNILDSSSLDENLAQLQINESEKSSVPTEDEQDDQNLEDTDDCGNQEINFIQEENISVDVVDKEVISSSSGVVEEPVNQEVPEPNIESVNSSQVAPANQDYHEMLPEEPLNQQIPIESGNKSRSTSSERERIVIRPREESPFKPPRMNNSAKGTVVQQEISEQKIKETKHTEDKTVVHEVNLETFPDNLERPPDYEELRKQSSFYVSHQKHLRTELNSSPSSLLCDNPDIPCVTLAPAAPPILSSSKSDKSESSSDSRREMALYDNPATSKNVAKESNHSSPAYVDLELSEQSPSSGRSYPHSGNNTIERKSARSSNKIPISSLIPTQPEPLNNKQNIQNLTYPYLKDSKIKEIRNPENFRKPAPNIENSQNPHSTQVYNSNHSDYSTSSGPRTDKRYAEHEAEISSHSDFSNSRPRTDGKYTEHEAEFSSHSGISPSKPRIDRRYADPEAEFSSPSDISSASRLRADGKYMEHEAEFSSHSGISPSKPTIDRRYADPEAEFSSRSDISSASRLRADGKYMEHEAEFSSHSGISVSKPRIDRRYADPEAEFSSRSDISSASRPRTDAKYTEHEAEFSSHSGISPSKPRIDRRYADPEAEFSSRSDISSAARPRTDGKYTEHEAEFSNHSGISSSKPRIDRRYADPETEFSSRSDISSASRPRTDRKYTEQEAEYNRQKFADRKYPSFDERQYYSDRERSRPPSRSSLDDRSEDYRYPYKPKGDYPYPPHEDRRQGPPQDYGRPPSRMSESDVNRPDRHSQYDYYKQQYPYNGPYNRSQDYYQKPPNYRGYDYDPYQRDPYAAYYDAYRYAYSNYNYGFYDELYRNDPRYQQYRQEQVRQYYAKYGYEGDYERSSAHSGRSSANELTKEMTSNLYPEHDNMSSNASEISAYNIRQDYSYDDVQNEVSISAADHSSTPSTRLTPVKFPYAHPIARFSAGGMLITAIPSQVDSTLPAPVKLQNMQLIMENEESYQDLKNYQGPLIRGQTHKNDVVEFCSQRIKVLKRKDDVVDRDSYILLWELMILLLRQNGSVAGSDIAELLLKDHEVLRPHAIPLRHTIETPLSEQSPAEVNDSSSQSHAGDTSSPDEGIVVLHDKSSLNTPKTVDVDKVTRKFREFLLFGHKKDALEWAMKHGLWGHALFLASKMDLRTYANVMTRFANSLALNDPLQTLYQLMSGRQPSAVTCVADKKWSDWRPHLAMILSNPSTLPDVDSRSITTLGDTLASRGCLPAAHFCYIMAQVDFGTFEQKNSKLVLLSTDHRLSFEEFAVNEAIQCTEIYEYAQSLANPGYLLIHLQMYKYLYALRLVEHGFLEEALHYCEVIAENLQTHPTLFSYDLIAEVFKLASRLKYHDPHFLRGQGEFEDQDDPEWLKNLEMLVQNYDNILQGQNTQLQYEEQPEPIQTVSDQQQPPIDNGSYQSMPQPGMQTEMSNSVNNTNFYQQSNWNQQTSLPNTANLTNNQQEMHPYYQSEMMNNQNNFQFESSVPSHEENETTDVPSSPVTQTPPFDYYSGSNQQVSDNRQPSYDSVNNYTTTATRRERRDSALSSGSRYSTSNLSVARKPSVKEASKPEPKKETKPSSQAGKTWLGGIFSRLLPKGPNQMILPDDKNPTIVWDEVNKCWINKDSNDEDETNAPLAPPTDMELMGSKSSEKPSVPPGNSSMPPVATSPVNKFQRPKTRGMRQNYVDILNNSGATTKSSVPPEALFPSSFEQTSVTNMFVPPSVPSVGENSSELESTNSFNNSGIETEEQSQVLSAPLMFDPAEFDSRRSNMPNQRLTLGRTGRRTYPT